MYHTYDHEYKVYLDIYKGLKIFSENYLNVDKLPKDTNEALQLIKDTINQLNTTNVNVVKEVLNNNKDITKVSIDGTRLSTTAGYHRYKEGILHIVYKLSHRNDPDCITNLDLDLRFLKYGIKFNWYSIHEMSTWTIDDYFDYDKCGKVIAITYKRAIDDYLRKHTYNSLNSITTINTTEGAV